MRIQANNMIESNIFQYNYQICRFTLSQHQHRFPELLYVRDGSVRLRLGDEYSILSAGDFIFIHPMQIHGYHTFSFCSCVVSAFPTSLAGSVLLPADKVGETPVFRCSPSVDRHGQNNIAPQLKFAGALFMQRTIFQRLRYWLSRLTFRFSANRKNETC